MAIERQWSEAQTAAIRMRGGPILVSAGAGSGKTSVLVKRVITRILADDGADVDRLLVVTFTDAAAAEMSERIAAALREAAEDRATEKRALRQLHLLDRAPISTLHSFCLQAARASAGGAGVDPGFRVASQDEADLLADATLDSLMEHWLADERRPIADFVERFGGDLGEETLRTLILQLHQFARSQAVPDRWLEQALARFVADAAGPLADASFAPRLFAGVGARLEESLTHLREASRVCFGTGQDAAAQLLAEEADRLADVLETAARRDHDAAAGALARIFAPRLTFPKDVDPTVRERVQALRDRAKKLVKSLREGVCGRSEDTLLAELRELAPHIETLAGLTTAFSAAYQEAKALRGTVDFSDLEHLARAALADGDGTPTDLARHFQQYFVEIMVDEYQDTSPIQDDIIRLVAQPESRNLFLVGDVKQSIYRFRMAEPRLFLERFALYENPETGVRIDLADNYRSRGGVVDAVNFFFEQIFTPEFGGVAYDERSRMKAGACYPEIGPDKSTLDGPVELHIVERTPDPAYQGTDGEGVPEDEAGERDGAVPDADQVEWAAAEREALVAGSRLKELHDGGALVYRPQRQTYEPVKWRDMAVLMRAKSGRMEHFLRVFRQLGIPVAGDSDAGYYSGYELRLALSLLQIVDNADQDIPLAAVLRSPVGGFTSTDLALVRAKRRGSLLVALRACAGADELKEDAGNKARRFLQKLDEWRTEVRSHALAEAVELLLHKADLLRFCSSLPGGAVREANLRQLALSARSFAEVQTGGFGDFVRYLERHRLHAGDVGASPALGEQEDVVRIMTIHKSKGLEFPVVVVAGLGQQFRLRRSSRIALHRTLGFGPAFVDLNRREVYPTAASAALEDALLQDDLAEEARILYVAMTRAREKLILVGAERNLADRREKWRQQAGPHADGRVALPAPVLLGGRSFLEWIGPCVFRGRAKTDELVRTRLWDTAAGDPLPMPKPDGAPSAALDRVAAARLDPFALSPHDAMADHEEFILYRERLLRHVCEPHAMDGPSGVPMKLSVSDWRRASREQDETDGTVEFAPATMARRFARPRFVQSQEHPSAVERGMLVHVAMQRLDLARALYDDGVMRDELARLAERLGWSQAQLDAVPVAWLTGFFSSPFGRAMLAPGARVVRELPFTFAVPARVVAALQGGGAQDGGAQGGGAQGGMRAWVESDRVIVQGTADCVLLASDGFELVDYKTDQLDGGRLAVLDGRTLSAYRTQVTLYCTALSRALGLPAQAAYLYFMSAGEMLPVTELALDL